METANAHYHNGHHQPSDPSLPASPTLTNPDMILPDYPRGDSPDFDLNTRDHSLLMWRGAQGATSSTDLHHMFVATGLVGPGAGNQYGLAGPVTPTTPIIYGNGTMLSDIGEVTEVESTVGKPSPVWTRSAARRPVSPVRGGGSDVALRSSPTMGAAAMIKRKSRQSLGAKHGRRSSMESNTTITTGDRAGHFPDFDDTVSVGDSVFQGDDEESLASSYVEGTAVIEPVRLGVARLENLDRLSTYSSTSLSRRAEEILANAKKRLTTMEGNLTRARGSLQDASPYGSDDRSTPSPPLQRAVSVMYSRDTGVDSRHARMSSDVAMQGALTYGVALPRSQSALGAAGGYRQPLVASKSADHIRQVVDDESGRPAHGTHPRGEGPKALTVDEVARLGGPDSASQNARLEAFLSPTFGSFSDGSVRNLQRPSSTVQVRDIKDQMRDLKGKISSLRAQARVDNLKRRSLQSLRTPSPFTHSQMDQWYAESQSNRASEIAGARSPGINPWNGEESSVDGDAMEDAFQLQDEHAEEDAAYAALVNGVKLGHAASLSPEPEPAYLSAVEVEANQGSDSADSDMHTENGEMAGQEETFHDAEDVDYMSESGESLYHDTVQHQISHEDREDAFDYEHFFLHSAMGTMSQRLARRGSVESFTSEDSVETTKGPVVNGTKDNDLDRGPPLSRFLSRSNSSASVSTVGTFATAQERRSLKSPECPDDTSPGSDGAFESFSRAISVLSTRHRSDSTATSKRLSFAGPATAHPATSNTTTPSNSNSDGSISTIAEESTPSSSPPSRHPATHRPLSTPASPSALVRPSIASFDSTGTSRSFPLVNRTLQPPHRSSSSSSSSSTLERRLRRETHRLLVDQTVGENGGEDALDALRREDRLLVERLVAGLGRCVLGLTETGRAGAESRMYRRRIEAARRVLEGEGQGAGWGVKRKKWEGSGG
ncbi:hypothetical protein BT67DRAFT_435966 [Trichocladium antarcticum]|uniref:Uncharacterized protein n=1 Tax=Trichocladium antarcticum TaxID=1450529 RepID=A0AAN6ZBL7_9PEZI|nr:hypothetical protein BT67DRAFT_435966 [Trichocladium antarcticum]